MGKTLNMIVAGAIAGSALAAPHKFYAFQQETPERYLEGVYVLGTPLGPELCNVTHSDDKPNVQIVECTIRRPDSRTLERTSIDGKLVYMVYDFGNGKRSSYFILSKPDYDALKKDGADMSGWLVEGGPAAQEEGKEFDATKMKVIQPENRIAPPRPPTMPGTRVA